MDEHEPTRPPMEPGRSFTTATAENSERISSSTTASPGVAIDLIKKRRSVITRGRRSTQHHFYSTEGPQEICKQYSKDLPADERLCSVVRSCVKYAFGEVESKESIPMDDILKSELKLALNNAVDELNDEGLFKLATTPIIDVSNKILPAPVETCREDKTDTETKACQPESSDVEEVIRDAEETIQRLNAECNRWDEILHNHQSESSINEPATKKTIGYDDDCGSSFESVVRGVDTRMQQLKHHMKILSKSTSTLCTLNNNVDEYLTMRAKTLQSQLECDGDCKQLLKDIISGASLEKTECS